MSNKFNMTFGETYKVLEDGYQEGYKQGKQDALASINNGRLQQKIVTPSNEIQVIKADDGYYGLSDVIVSPPVIDGEVLLEAINVAKNNINENVNSVKNNVDEAETSINNSLKVVIDFANGEIDKIVDERINERIAVDLGADY